jgi:Ser/Thr protein kinase RdoA (MazF antagonist)
MSFSRTILRGLAEQFAIYGEFESAAPFGKGHINETFASRWNQGGTPVRYLHQRINDRVFTKPNEVMENIQRVTGHIANKFKAAGESGWTRRTLTVVPGRDGKPWVRDADGGWWRTYLFIEGAHSPDLASSPEEARILGSSIGSFQKQLADLPPPRLHETIPDFHNMESRYSRFHDALAKDICSRAAQVKTEITFFEENEHRGGILIRSLREGRIPERICHNDAKMNNILIDNQGSQVLCVADLDTVMPGTVLFDLGDLVRTVTSRAEEDEQDLARVYFDPPYFEALLAGYVSEAADFLVPEERELLIEAGRNITQIMGLRFLTDYLEGDHYYHIARPEHNLDRCRNQIALIKSMDAQWDRAEAIARSINQTYPGRTP